MVAVQHLQKKSSTTGGKTRLLNYARLKQQHLQNGKIKLEETVGIVITRVS